MGLGRSKREWDELATLDPLWAILSDPQRRGNRWQLDAFFATGEQEMGEVLRIARSLGYPARSEAALDFGCGVGRLTRAMASHFGQCCGIDISEEMIEQARSLNADLPNCTFLVNAAGDLRLFSTGSFDFVYSSIVLQHLPNVELIHAYIREFLRVLCPGGILVFQLPYHIPWRNQLQLRRRLWAAGRSLGLSARLLYGKAGLNPVRMLAVPLEDVESTVESNGARVVHAQPDDAPQQPIRSFRYFVSLQ